MIKWMREKSLLSLTLLCAAHVAVCAPMASVSPPMVIEKIYNTAKNNENWKTALATGKQAQIVLMNVSPQTNPNNEVGMETHPFDQIVLIAEGRAKVILDGKNGTAAEGDLIFIPQGTAHNIINLNGQKPLKIVSFYSLMDIPPNSTYAKKADQPSG